MQKLVSALVTVHQHTQGFSAPGGSWFEAMAEDLPHFVWSSDARGRKTYCSRKYLDYTGAASTETMNVDWSKFVHPEDRAEAAARWLRALETGEPYDAEYRFFEPFFTTRGENRTGLALWIAGQIVQRHGGRIQCRSCTERGRSGTVFAIVLPHDPVD